MKLHYMGKYDLNPESLPCNTHMRGAVPFKEAKDMKEMAKIMSILSVIMLLVFGFILYLRYSNSFIEYILVGSIFALLSLFPHELLHAICFKEDVYLYTNFKQGMLFVVGTETMSKGRFIFMSLLPNLIFGIIPFGIGLIWPSLSILGAFGVLSISMGAGDYYNIFNALTQMPGGSRTYLYQFSSYWYMPD
ncbi:DUF3267 domain-containing protein [Anaeromicropila herbilytica]|uniref:DUF3267 domain-containing protein n=1 Tax=Anaeromicropila herbilytica TaxID=2785025 RepID=A0A7R7EL59_9FIRM|nr:DUF3267 domain-containing protein [Anaeromicropila herbilytica]BCN30807.1 hypothetical protein bsdtb5_21020 [Anaeromicropila herbilytica]